VGYFGRGCDLSSRFKFLKIELNDYLEQYIGVIPTKLNYSPRKKSAFLA